MKVNKYLSKCKRIIADTLQPSKITMKYSQAQDCLNAVNCDVHESCYLQNARIMAEDKFDLSVIIPTYNRCNFVCRMVDSILQQNTEYSFEVIIVDDGSTDNTAEVLKKYTDNSLVRVIRQKNQGPSVSRNTAINIAQGRYLMFGDDDDLYLPGTIKKLLTAAYSYDADIVEGQVIKVEDGIEIKKPTVKNDEIVTNMSLLTGYSCAKVFRKKLFLNIIFQPGYWYEDFLHPKVMYRIAKTCVLIPDFVYQYEIHGESITGRSAGNVKALDSLYVTRQLLCDCKKMGLPENQKTYKAFLKTAHTINRLTFLLDEQVCQAVFITLCYLIEKYYSQFSLEPKDSMKKLEKALRTHNYRSYLLVCELLM